MCGGERLLPSQPAPDPILKSADTVADQKGDAADRQRRPDHGGASRMQKRSGLLPGGCAKRSTSQRPSDSVVVRPTCWPSPSGGMILAISPTSGGAASIGCHFIALDNSVRPVR
jgi:hypothetical protein